MDFRQQEPDALIVTGVETQQPLENTERVGRPTKTP
jgi:hypothetical protein